MTDLIKEILFSPFGSAAAIFAVLLLSFWLTHWVTKQITRINSSHGILSTSIARVESHIDEVRKDISYLKGTTDIIRMGNHPLTKSKSPVTLTDLGNSISAKLNAEEMICRNWDDIYLDLETNVGSNNAYDIQKYCIETATVELSKLISKVDLEKVKTFAFNDGKPLAYYAPIFGILVRDKYFEMKGIDIIEVDEHTPIVSD